jgi:hypothetical protein
VRRPGCLPVRAPGVSYRGGLAIKSTNSPG